MLKKLSCSLLALTLAFNSAPALVNNSINIGVVGVNAEGNVVEAKITSTKLDGLKTSGMTIGTNVTVGLSDITIPEGYEFASIESDNTAVATVTESEGSYILTPKDTGEVTITVTASEKAPDVVVPDDDADEVNGIDTGSENITATWNIEVKAPTTGGGTTLPNDVVVTPPAASSGVTVNKDDIAGMLGEVSVEDVKAVEVEVVVKSEAPTDAEKTALATANIVGTPAAKVVYPTINVNVTKKDDATVKNEKASGKVTLSLQTPSGAGTLKLVSINNNVATVVSDAFANGASEMVLTAKTSTVDVTVNHVDGNGYILVLESATAVTALPTLSPSASSTGHTILEGLEVIFTPDTTTGTTAETVTATVGSDGRTMSLPAGKNLYVGVNYDVSISTRSMLNSYLTLTTTTWTGANTGSIGISSESMSMNDNNKATITITDLPAGTWKVYMICDDIPGAYSGSPTKTLTTAGSATFELSGLCFATGGVDYNVYVAQFVDGVELPKKTLGEVAGVDSASFTKSYAYPTTDGEDLKGDGVTDVTVTAPTIVTVKEFSATGGVVGKIEITTVETVDNSSFATVMELMTFEVTTTSGAPKLTVELSGVLTTTGYKLAVFEQENRSSPWVELTTDVTSTEISRAVNTSSDMSVTFPVQNGAKYTLAYVTPRSTGGSPGSAGTEGDTNNNSSSSGNVSSGSYYSGNNYSDVSVRVNGSYVSALQNVLLGELVNLNNITTINGNTVIGWYYDSALTQEITNTNAFVIDSNVVNNGIFAKFASVTPETNTDSNVNTPTTPTTPSVVPSTIAKLLGKLF